MLYNAKTQDQTEATFSGSARLICLITSGSGSWMSIVKVKLSLSDLLIFSTYLSYSRSAFRSSWIGYKNPDDPYVLKGSCGLEYKLVYTSGYQRQGYSWEDSDIKNWVKHGKKQVDWCERTRMMAKTPKLTVVSFLFFLLIAQSNVDLGWRRSTFSRGSASSALFCFRL